MKKSGLSSGPLSFVILIGACSLAQQSLAQWSQDPAQNLQILQNCIKPRTVSDGNGGAIVVAETFTVNPIFYAQRVDKYGKIVWDPSLRGIRVSTAGDEQAEALVVADGEGGAYVGFNARTIIGYYPEPPEPKYASRVRIQRIDSHGILLWGSQGAKLYDYPIDSTGEGQGIYGLVPGDNGGVYALWADSKGPQGNNVYVNHVSSNGQVSWQNSIALNPPLTTIKKDFLIYSDGEGGLIIYYLAGGTSLPHRFLRINRDGQVIVDKSIATGLTVFYLFSASAGECILFWQDFNQFGRLDTLRCQKLNRNGEKMWGEKQIIVDSAGQLSTPLTIGRLPNETGEAFFAFRRGVSGSKLVRLDRDGRIRFKKPVDSFNGTGWNQQECMMRANNDGVIYSAYRSGMGLSVCAVDSNGKELWPAVIYSIRNYESDWDAAVSDGQGGIILVWHEILPLRGTWIQQVSGTGKLGLVTEVKEISEQKLVPQNFKLFPAYPNPFQGTVRLSYYLQQSQEVSLKIYDLFGKEVMTLVPKRSQSGFHEVNWDGRDQSGHPVSSGVYFYQLSTGTVTQWRKLILLR